MRLDCWKKSEPGCAGVEIVRVIRLRKSKGARLTSLRMTDAFQGLHRQNLYWICELLALGHWKLFRRLWLGKDSVDLEALHVIEE